MKTVSFPSGRPGGHSVSTASPPCPACAHPVRMHNPVGCVRGECECALTAADFAGPASGAAAAVEPPSSRSLDLLDPPCRCGHRRGKHAQAGSIVPCQRCACRGFTAPEASDASSTPPPGPVPGDLGPAPTGPAAGDETGPDLATAGATARAGFGLKTPRRQKPRPAGEALVVPAAVGGDDAGEEVAAEVPGDGAAATSIETAAVVAPNTAAVLDEDTLFAAALFVYRAWWCTHCSSRRLDPGACPDCKRALQPVHVAILPREVHL